MKRLLLFLALGSIAALTQAKTIKALFDYKSFYAPGQGSYLEWYLSVKGNSVNYKMSESGNYEAAVAVAFKITQNDKIVAQDSYNLISPLTKDTLLVSDFIDNKRLQLPNGKYNIELSVKDNVADTKTFTINQGFELAFEPGKTSVSDIELVQHYSKNETGNNTLVKNGFEIIPRVDNFYQTNEERLIYYAEAYFTNSLTDDAVAVYSYLQNAESGSTIMDYGTVQRKKTSEVIPLLSEINIANLGSGNYNLIVEVKDKNNQSLALSKIFFQRQSVVKDNFVLNNDVSSTFVATMNDKNVLAENIACLQPISNAQQSEWIGNQLKAANIDMMKNFFYDFWQRREPVDPQKAWNDYKAHVDAVQQKFGSRALKGYNTDMGRVYLAYGAPSTINKGEYEPNTYPYEIWRYDKINNHTNKTFVFYSKDLLARNFTLLHSDMPGEPYEAAWNMILHDRSIKAKNIDDTGKDLKGVYSGDRTNDNFNAK